MNQQQNPNPKEQQLKFQSDVKLADNAQEMSKEATADFMSCCLLERKVREEPMPAFEELPFCAKIILKRIEVYELPIKFTLASLLALVSLAEQNPGRCIVALIDCLTAYEGQTINTEKLVKLYPNGMYNELKMREYVTFLQHCKANPNEGLSGGASWAFIY